MKRSLLFIGIVAALSITSVYADTVAVRVTASTTVSNVPADFSTKQFALLRPWEFDSPPAFQISVAPTVDTLSVNSLNTMPALEVTDHTPPNNGLTWYYYCDGLKFNYAGSSNNSATVVFSGQIDPQHPGSGVACTCSGSACSTTATIPAKLFIG